MPTKAHDDHASPRNSHHEMGGNGVVSSNFSGPFFLMSEKSNASPASRFSTAICHKNVVKIREIIGSALIQCQNAFLVAFFGGRILQRIMGWKTKNKTRGKRFTSSVFLS